MNLTDFERGFITGLFEGEGSIILSKTNRKYTRGRKGQKYPSNRFYIMNHITITNTNLKLLKYAQKLIGGKIRLHSHNYKTQKPSFILGICNQQQILDLLSEIYPHLIEKRKKAKLI